MRMFAAVMPFLLPVFEGATDVVQSGTQTPPTLPQPVHPLLVMQTQPVAQSEVELQVGTWSQNEFCAQTAAFSVLVKQKLPSGPPQPHEGKPLLQLPAVEQVEQLPAL